MFLHNKNSTSKSGYQYVLSFFHVIGWKLPSQESLITVGSNPLRVLDGSHHSVEPEGSLGVTDL